MYDVKVLHLLDKVIESLEVIQQRTENIHCTNDFLDSATGTLLLDGVCMKLIATGESIKNCLLYTSYTRKYRIRRYSICLRISTTSCCIVPEDII